MSEATRVMNWLASAGPLANAAVTGKVADEIMLATGGQIMARGGLYYIKSNKLSQSVWRLSLERAD